MGVSENKQLPLDVCLDLIGQVESLRDFILSSTESEQGLLAGVTPEHRRSAANLMHYLALRSRDNRPLQDALARLGLASLDRVESHVLPTVNAILHNLYLVSGRQGAVQPAEGLYAGFGAGSDRLEQNTEALFGPFPSTRRVHIIVTMPTGAADDYLAVHHLLNSGMNCMRINCAHDGPAEWLRMIEHLRNAERATGRPCRVLMDLGGPKLRTGPMERLPGVCKIRPVRSAEGQVMRPARIWLGPHPAQPGQVPAADASLVVDADWLGGIKPGDKLRLKDSRGSGRTWRVREVTPGGCWVESKKTTYVSSSTVLRVNGSKADTTVSGLPPRQAHIVLRVGDMLMISATDRPGKAAIHDADGELLNPGCVSLPIPEIYRDVRPGESVCFDDGRIAGMVEKCLPDQLQVRITHTRKPVERLEGNRGVNLPDSALDLPALSDKDLRDLPFVARHADMVGLSFTNRPEDVRALRERLLELGGERVGAVLKIETRRGFSNLPRIIVEALGFPACGVMIARGDLAVECGFERLSEVQEEILWICEAAHVPVIWATQVLEGLTKRGHATRAEITDAAMSQAAEAVMLNKGPYVNEAIRTLDDILQRMQGHHRKKHSMLRRLHLASEFEA